ncbi:MAG: UPF0175 family protein [Candidatus Bathyarchaeia archaeon]
MKALALKPLAVRIPEDVEREILELAELEKLDKATAVRRLLEIGIEERRKQAVLGMLKEGRLTFAKAAEKARLSLWELADLVKQRNIEWVRYTPEEIDEEVRKAYVAE